MTPIADRNSSLVSRWRYLVMVSVSFRFFAVLFFFPFQAVSQGVSAYEETLVSLKIPKIGVTEVPGYILDDQLYLPLTDIFTFLRIKNVPTAGYDTISGFFINEQSAYLVDRGQNRITYQGQVFNLGEGDLVRTESNLYLRSDYFGLIFGLNMFFDFRSLTVTLRTSFELPVLREMRMELMRKDQRRLKGDIVADTLIRPSYPLFYFGMADWSLITGQYERGKGTVNLNVNLGGVILGGSTNFQVNYNNQRPITGTQLYYQWHYANNENRFLRQVRLGKVAGQQTSSLYGSLIGVQLTNSPTTFRRSFGTFTLSDYTQPGWLVELYVNNVLVDYQRADASGFFTFEVPLVYGSSNVMLRFFGPWGEERITTRNINIPYNFITRGKAEYSVTAGMVEAPGNPRFGRGGIYYGISNRITAGCGVEYLSSVQSGSLMPFLRMSVRLADALFINGEYTYGVRFRSHLSYRTVNNLQLELFYQRYHAGQQAINTNYLEERKIMVSRPGRIGRISTLMRLTVNDIQLSRSRNTIADFLISANAYKISLNLTTYAFFSGSWTPFVYSTFSAGFRLPLRVLFTPQVQFEYNTARLVLARADLERQFSKDFVIKLTGEYNLTTRQPNIQGGIMYNLPFAQTGLTAVYTRGGSSFLQTARGSIIADPRTHWVGFSNSTSVKRGGIVVVPFLDMNLNNRRDVGEPKVPRLDMRITGGRSERNKKDSTIRILDLEPYTNFYLELDRTEFDNVAWQIRKPVVSVAVDPNQIKLVEIPVAVLGEATGMVYVSDQGVLTQQGRVILNFYRLDSTLAGRTLSEPDGYFSYLGLAPGDYQVRVDSVQLRKIRMATDPDHHRITIRQMPEGDQVGGLDFVLTSENSSNPGKDSLNDEPEVPADFGAGSGSLPLTSGFTLEIGRYNSREEAARHALRLQSALDVPVTVEPGEKFTFLRIRGIGSLERARFLLEKTNLAGYPDASILKE